MSVEEGNRKDMCLRKGGTEKMSVSVEEGNICLFLWKGEQKRRLCLWKRETEKTCVCGRGEQK